MRGRQGWPDRFETLISGVAVDQLFGLLFYPGADRDSDY